MEVVHDYCVIDFHIYELKEVVQNCRFFLLSSENWCLRSFPRIHVKPCFLFPHVSTFFPTRPYGSVEGKYVGGGNMDNETSVDWRARSHGSLEEAFDKVLYHDSLYSLS